MNSVSCLLVGRECMALAETKASLCQKSFLFSCLKTFDTESTDDFRNTKSLFERI